MTEEQKQALIKDCRDEISKLERAISNVNSYAKPAYRDEFISEYQSQLQRQQIALAALTAQPDDWKQRAEAAEAKLAGLAKQKPRYQIQKRLSYGRESLWIDVACREEAENNVIHGFRWRMVYDAPAPAADLAELVPPSWRLVPVEPTKQMLEASYREASVYSPTAYRAMLAAAPTPNE